MSSKQTRVVLAEDNSSVRKGLRLFLRQAEDIDVVGEARDGMEALDLVKKLLPDLLLLDVEMPGLNGIAVAQQLHEMGNSARILVLSAYDDREYIRSMLANGASGYLIKDEAPERILEAVRGVALGEVGWVSPQVRERMARKH